MSDLVIEIMDMWAAGNDPEVISEAVSYPLKEVLECIETYSGEW